MSILVTGSSGHLGEALMRRLGGAARGLDLLAGPHTAHVGSITDRALLRQALRGVDAVLHTATLHKPHVASHGKQAFLDTNIAGTLALLEESLAAGVTRFVFTSTTSAFGAALSPEPHKPAAWIDESVVAVPKNIYGVTKTAAEDLCQLFYRDHGLPCLVLRTSRFFPEEDDDPTKRAAFPDENAKANEFLFRRVDVEDAAIAHEAALERAPEIGFSRYIISATTPFRHHDLARLRRDPAGLVAELYPRFTEVYAARGYRMFDSLDRVYDNAKARQALGWQPRYDFARILEQLAAKEPIGSDLVRAVGSKGYHAEGRRYPFL